MNIWKIKSAQKIRPTITISCKYIIRKFCANYKLEKYLQAQIEIRRAESLTLGAECPQTS